MSQAETTAIQEPKTSKRKGRPTLTPEQRLVSMQKKKEYFQNYFKDHPEKFKKKYKGRDYSKSQIYRLVGADTDRIYIGCTTLPLEIRYKQHLASMFINHTNASYEAMLKLTAKWKIEPIVKCPVQNKTELEDLESIWITANADKCVNKCKRYKPDEVDHLLDGRYPDEYLPGGFKNKKPV